MNLNISHLLDISDVQNGRVQNLQKFWHDFVCYSSVWLHFLICCTFLIGYICAVVVICTTSNILIILFFQVISCIQILILFCSLCHVGHPLPHLASMVLINHAYKYVIVNTTSKINCDVAVDVIDDRPFLRCLQS